MTIRDTSLVGWATDRGMQSAQPRLVALRRVRLTQEALNRFLGGASLSRVFGSVRLLRGEQALFDVDRWTVVVGFLDFFRDGRPEVHDMVFRPEGQAECSISECLRIGKGLLST